MTTETNRPDAGAVQGERLTAPTTADIVRGWHTPPPAPSGERERLACAVVGCREDRWQQYSQMHPQEAEKALEAAERLAALHQERAIGEWERLRNLAYARISQAQGAVRRGETATSEEIHEAAMSHADAIARAALRTQAPSSAEPRASLRERLDGIRAEYLPPDARNSLLQYARYYMSHDEDCEPMGPLGCTCLMLTAREALDAVDAVLALVATPAPKARAEVSERERLAVQIVERIGVNEEWEDADGVSLAPLVRAYRALAPSPSETQEAVE